MDFEKSSPTTSSPGKLYEDLLRQKACTKLQDPRPSDDKVRQLRLTLQTYIGEALMKQLYQEVTAHCAGCIVDHPSQLRHQCLFSTKEDWIEWYLEIAMKKLSFPSVMELWYPELNQQNLTQKEAEELYHTYTNIKDDFEHKTSEPWFREAWAQQLLRME